MSSKRITLPLSFWRLATQDDIVLVPQFNRRLQTIIAELPDDWDVCLLGAFGCVSIEKEALPLKLYALFCGGGRPSPGRTRGISESLFEPYKPAGTHAYVVSQSGARKLLKRLPRARYHIDITAWALQDLRLYAAKEWLASQRFDDDTTVS